MSRTGVLVSVPLTKNVCEVLIFSTWQVMALKCVWVGLTLDIFHFAHLTVRSDRHSPFQAPMGLAFQSIVLHTCAFVIAFVRSKFIYNAQRPLK